MRLWKKPMVIAAASAVLVSGALMTNTTFAAEAQKKLTAVYSDIVIKFNGSTVSTDSATEPFIVNGTTFVPVRLIGEATGSTVTWDQTTKTINIADDSSANQETVNSLTQQLAEAQIQLADKEAEIAELTSQLAAALEDDEADIDDLESDIQDDYEDYEDTEASISLSGDEDEIEVTIEVDEDGWDDLSTSEQTSYLQDIADDILDVYEDAAVEGTVENDDSDTLASFETDSSGDVDMVDEDMDIGDLEDQLNDDWGDYQDVNWDIYVSGDEDEMTIEVYVAEEDWDELSTTNINNFQDNVMDDAEDAFPDADIEGIIYSVDDGSELDTF